MKELVETYTLPILKEIENDEDQDQAQYEGSGILYTHNKQYYILTAYHVLEEFKENKQNYFIPSGEEMINLSGDLEYDAGLDIAILKINESDVCKFENYEFVTENMIESNLEAIEEVFLLGYPSSRTHFVPISSEVKYTVLYGKAKLENTMNHDARCNNQNKIFIKYPENWNTDNIPHPKGMSGSGVWLTDNGRLRLIGINHYFDRNSTIEAIKIQLYMKALEFFTNKD